MTKIHLANPTVAALLADFFSSYRLDADPGTRDRIRLVRKDLIDHLDEEGWRVLDPSQTVLLEAEAQLGRPGAFARVAHASDMFCILEHYLNPVHAQMGIDQRATQLDVVAALTKKLWDEGHISPRSIPRNCRIEFDVALNKGRNQVNEARAREKKLQS